MAERIIFALQKGGAGKSTSTVATAEILAAAGYKVLVVDFDSQGNSTKMITKNSIYKYSGHTIMEAIQAGNAMPFILPVKEGLDLIPAEDRLAVFSRYIYTSRIERPYAVLNRLLEAVDSAYDFVFVDVGPTLGDTLINAIVYAERIIVPVDTGDFALDALIRFTEFIEETRAEGHTNAEIEGILLTLRDGRPTRYERDISDGIRAAYGDLVFKTEINRRVKIKEMSSTGIDVTADAMSDYMSFTEELLAKIRGREENNHE